MIPTHFIPFGDLMNALRQQYMVLLRAPSTPPYRLRMMLVSAHFRGDPDSTPHDEQHLAGSLGLPWSEILANLHRLHIELLFGNPSDRAGIEMLMQAPIEGMATPQLPLWMASGWTPPTLETRVVHVVEHDGRGYSEAASWELAGLLAKQGKRVVLVDADPHSSGLETMIAPVPQIELANTIMALRCRVRVRPVEVPTKSGAVIHYVGFAPPEEELDPDRAAFVFDWANPQMVARLGEVLVQSCEAAVVILRHAAGLTPCVTALVRALPGSVVAIDATTSAVGRRHMGRLMECSPFPSEVLMHASSEGFWFQHPAHPSRTLYDGTSKGMDDAIGRIVERWQTDEVMGALQVELATKALGSADWSAAFTDLGVSQP